MNKAIFLVVVVVLLCWNQATCQENKQIEKSKELIDKVKNSQEVKIARNDLKQAGVLQDTTDTPKDIEKLDQAKSDLKTEFDKESFTVEDGGKIANAIATGVSKGLGNLVKGFKTKDPYYILSGTLQMMIALSTVMGPYGTIIGPILTIFSTVLDIFGKPAEESQEAMIQRVLDQMSVNDLKDEVAGMEMFYSSATNQVKILSHALKKKEGKVAESDLDALYTVSFNNFDVFGRIGEKIKGTCFPGVYETGGEAKTNIEGKAKNCLALLKIYCQISLIRQMFLAQIASLSKEMNFSVFSEKLLGLIADAQKNDQDVLKFLTKPLENPKARYSIYKLYAFQEENPIIVSYIKKLDDKANFDKVLKKDVEIDVEFDKRYVLLCTNQFLQGNCRLYGESGTRLVLPSHWGTATKSIFIPPTLRVRLLTSTDTTGMVYGPLFGLSVYSDSSLFSSVKSIQISHAQISSNKMVMICMGANKDWCQHVQDMSSQQELKTLGGRDFSNPSSILIPEGFSVTLLKDKMSIGPIYGHQVLKGVCGGSWETIKVQTTPLSSANFAIVCEEEKFEGYCQQLGSQFISDDRERAVRFDKTRSEERDSSCGVGKVGSVKVPASYTLFLYTSNDKLNGPWSGPIEMASIGPADLQITSAALVGNINNLQKGIVTKKRTGFFLPAENGRRRHTLRKIQKRKQITNSQLDEEDLVPFAAVRNSRREFS